MTDREIITELAASLKECLRMLDAVHYTIGIGKGAMERVERARAVLRKAEASQSSAVSQEADSPTQREMKT